MRTVETLLKWKPISIIHDILCKINSKDLHFVVLNERKNYPKWRHLAGKNNNKGNSWIKLWPELNYWSKYEMAKKVCETSKWQEMWEKGNIYTDLLHRYCTHTCLLDNRTEAWYINISNIYCKTNLFPSKCCSCFAICNAFFTP